MNKNYKYKPSAPDDSLRSEQVVDQLLSKITLEDDFSLLAGDMLRIIGENASVDRCYVFKYTDGDYDHHKKLFEWINPESAIHPLPNINESHFPECTEMLFKHEPIIIENFDNLPDGISQSEVSGLQVEGIKSILINGIWVNDTLYGFVGMDCFQEEKEFNHSIVHTVNCFANLFRLALERTKRKEALEESALLQKQIMDNISIPILLVDTNYRVMAANPTKKINVEIPLEKLLGTYCYDTVCKFGSPPEFCSVQETMQTKKPSSKEFSFGDKRLISNAQPIFDRNGEMQYILSVDIDITEVTRQKEELKIAMEQAQAANHAKSYFLATISHELRTPLNAVIGFTELLQSGVIDPKTRQEYLQSINFAGNTLLNMINDVLDLSNLESKQLIITPKLNNVSELINQIISVFKLKAQEKDIKLIADVEEVRYPLHVDNLRIHQILLNLLGNAIKFTSHGQVSVKVSFTPTNDEYGVLTIVISDTGIGISKENQERIFEPFVHDSIIRGRWMYEGSGLGLTITKRLLEMMGGTIRLESELGHGSTFTVQLDKVKYEHTKEISTSLEQPKNPVYSNVIKKRKMQALLVDDVQINLKVLSAMLKLQGVESTLVNSSETALEMLRKNSVYDLILTDMWMPKLNGAELTERIRNEKLTDIPIVAVTADTQISEKDKKLFAHILYKPITGNSLALMLNTVIPEEP